MNDRTGKKKKGASRLVRGGARSIRRLPGNEELYLQLVENIADHAVFMVYADGTIANWNLGAQRVYGYHAQEIINEPITRLIPPDRLAEEQAILDRVHCGERVEQFETVRLRKDGKRIEVWISMSPIRDARGRIVGAFKVVRDISERRKSSHALHDSEQRMRAILQTAVDAIITINDRGVIESVNPATEKLFGYSESELVGQNVRMLMPEPYQHEHDGYLRNYLRTGQARIIGIGREVAGLRKDGSHFPLSLSISEVQVEGRRIFTGIVHDLTERRLLEKQILEASVNEQRRIGQDLHDGLCQELVGLGFSAELLANQLQSKSPPHAHSARKLGDAIRQAASQARQLAHGLNPVDVKGGGLSGALKNLASKVSQSFGVRCMFKGDDAPVALQDAVATHLYRIAQESLSNAIKHGKAKRAIIELSSAHDRITLTIKDNGKGFPKSAGGNIDRRAVAPGLHAGERGTGMGLQTMQYRARIIGGTFDIRSQSRGGTVVICSIRKNSTRGTEKDPI